MDSLRVSLIKAVTICLRYLASLLTFCNCVSSRTAKGQNGAFSTDMIMKKNYAVIRLLKDVKQCFQAGFCTSLQPYPSASISRFVTSSKRYSVVLQRRCYLFTNCLKI